MPRREQDVDALLPDLDSITMVQLDVGVDTRLFIGRQLHVTFVKDIVASSMIVMRVGVQDIGDLESEVFDTRL